MSVIVQIHAAVDMICIIHFSLKNQGSLKIAPQELKPGLVCSLFFPVQDDEFCIEVRVAGLVSSPFDLSVRFGAMSRRHIRSRFPMIMVKRKNHAADRKHAAGRGVYWG
jgi:hypothetical protein